jgi:tetratricopeptide (TPR) repeat protein
MIASSAAADDAQTCEKDSGQIRFEGRDLAIAACTRAIQSGMRKGHDLAVLYSNRAILHSRKGDEDRANADFNEAIRLDSKATEAYQQRGGVYAVKGDYDRAIADYSEAIRLDPKYFAAYEGRGLASARHLEHTCLFCRAGGTTLPMVQRTIEGGHDRSATRPRAPFRGACETDAVSTAGIGAEYGVPDAVETR